MCEAHIQVDVETHLELAFRRAVVEVTEREGGACALSPGVSGTPDVMLPTLAAQPRATSHTEMTEAQTSRRRIFLLRVGSSCTPTPRDSFTLPS
jgi:hypothetical protein